MVSLISLAMTFIEDLRISPHYSFLTNTKIVTMKWNNLLFFKIMVLLTFVTTIILQIRIWKFKRRSTVNTNISINHSKTTTKSYQKTVGKVTLRIVLATMSIQLFYYLVMQHKYNNSITESYIQSLRRVTCSHIFTMNFLPMVWIATTPNLWNTFVTKLQKVKQRCMAFCIVPPKKKQEIVHCVHFDSVVPRNLEQEAISTSFLNTSKFTHSEEGNGIVIPLQSNNSTHQKGNPIQKSRVSNSNKRHITHKSSTPAILPIFEEGNKNLSKYKVVSGHGSHPVNNYLPTVNC